MDKVNDYPKISVITVCFNSVKTIEQTIDSIVKQTYPNIEYIIIDGGSTDGTIDIIKKYEDNIASWITENDHGIYDAMNKGIDMATGDYIQFLGSDDCLIDENVIGKIADYLKEADNPPILSAPIFVVDEKLGLQRIFDNHISKDRLLKGYMIPHPGMFVKTEIMKRYQFDTRYKIIADYEFLLHYFIDGGQIKYISEPVVYFSNAGASSQHDKLCLEYIDVMNFYNLPLDEAVLFIMKPKLTFKRMCMNHIKFLLNKLKLWRIVQNHRGWQRHSCKWSECRWCKLK